MRGRVLRGRRVYASSPHGHWHTTTMIGAIRLDGSTACMTIEGAADTEAFRAFVEQVLAPQLCAGASVLFLPAYSPNLNSIEPMWSKVKQSLRPAEARTHAALIEAIAAALEYVTPQDAMNWFAHCGYSVI